MQVYTNGNLVITMNRHKRVMISKMDLDELKKLHRGKGWMVLCGELMNKSQKDEDNKTWNHKFIIFDILSSSFLCKQFHRFKLPLFSIFEFDLGTNLETLSESSSFIPFWSFLRFFIVKGQFFSV